MDGKAISTAYWVVTILFCLAIGAGGVADLVLLKEAVEIVKALGYPEYFIRMIGAWKVLGVIALLAPGFPRLKEWAYAGMAFDLIGASVSHCANGHPAKDVAVPLVLLGVGALSYVLRPEERRMSAPL